MNMIESTKINTQIDTQIDIQINNKQINDWYTSKKKLRVNSDLIKLEKYLNELENVENVEEIINFSNDYEFRYWNIDKIECKKIKVRPENIFKLSFLKIIKQLKKYFNNINIKIKFESASNSDKLIKKENSTYKHDAYIIIEDLDQNYYYDIGLEFFEKIHDRIKDNDKEISSNLLLDGYYIYEEKKKNFNEFVRDTIQEILVSICALINDKYTLAKINFFAKFSKKTKTLKSLKSLKSDTELFNLIINYQKNNSFCLKELFKKLKPKNEESFTYNEFVEYLLDELEIDIKFDEENGTTCTYEYFCRIIMTLNNDCSTRILNYKEMYMKAMNILIDSQEQIIKYAKRNNQSKKNIPKYIDNLLRLHIQNCKDQDTLEKAYKNLANKFN